MGLESNRSTGVTARLGLFTILTVVLAGSGCVNVLLPYNQPSQQKFRVKSPIPQQYIVRVADKLDYPVAADGRVTVEAPQMERGCATYLFGVVKIKDSAPYDVRTIHLRKNNHTIRKLSLNDLAKLPIDEHGYRLVIVE